MAWFGRRKEARISRKSQRDIKNAESLEEKIMIEIELPRLKDRRVSPICIEAKKYLNKLELTYAFLATGKSLYVEMSPKDANKIAEDISQLVQKNIEEQEKLMKDFDTKILIANLKEREKATSYTLGDVLKHPLKYCTKGFSEAASEPFSADASINPDIFAKGKEGKVSGKRRLRFYSCLFAAFGVTSVPHELIHAGVNKLTGGVNHEIAINKFFGGDIAHYFIPEVQAKWMIPIMGGYVKFENSSYLANMETTIAPYIMTPFGIYLLKKGKEKKNLILAYLGGGLVAGHAGGVLGDFWGMGRQTIDKLGSLINSTYSPDFLSSVAGFCLGTVILSYTYRLSKGTVNSLQQRKFYSGKHK